MEIVSIVNCHLAQLGMQKYTNEVFGIACGEENDFELLNLLLWAYNLNCSDKGKLSLLMSKFTKHCKNCKPKRYKTPKIIFNPDYSVWYNSDEYRDCLNLELLQNGYIEEIHNFCDNISIAITKEELCNDILIALMQENVECGALANVAVLNSCKNTLASISSSLNCNPPDSNISQDNCKVDSSITNLINCKVDSSITNLINCDLKSEITAKICNAIIKPINND